VTDRGRARSRSRTAGALGAALLVAAWLFGSVVAATAGIGLVAAALAAAVWRRVASRALTLERVVESGPLVEGDTFRAGLRLHGRSLLLGRVTAYERVGDNEVVVRLRGRRGRVEVRNMPRGRHALGPAEVVVQDPLGLERVAAVAPPDRPLLVRPRTVELERLLGDAAGRAHGGRLGALRRPTGLELHSVRDYEAGEPLRAVHWPSTARRGQLMVRELEDAPRDDVVVVLDADRGGLAGTPGVSSFDEAVRVAASLVRASVVRRRHATLVVAGQTPTVMRLSALDGDWDAALDLLAGCEADGDGSLAGVLVDLRGPSARAGEVIVVTARPSSEVARRLESARRGALVAIDAPTYAGKSPSRAGPSLLRLAAAGVPVAVVRRGDDLREVLGGTLPGRRSA
jgi:uncharacterized protein (DUF58 family)